MDGADVAHSAAGLRAGIAKKILVDRSAIDRTGQHIRCIGGSNRIDQETWIARPIVQKGYRYGGINRPQGLSKPRAFGQQSGLIKYRFQNAGILIGNRLHPIGVWRSSRCDIAACDLPDQNFARNLRE